MKILLLLSCLLTATFLLAQTPQRCGADYSLQQQAQNPAYQSERKALEAFTEKWIKENRHASNRMIYTIPVVVHIVWKEEEENISAEQVQSQIDVLNEDFRGLNNDLNRLPSAFSHLATDVGIEFCLATINPEGNSHTGITRRQTFFSNIANFVFDNQNRRRIKHNGGGGTDAWDTNAYLNIWVGRADEFVGEASFPGELSPADDGIVIDYRVFGKIGTAVNNVPFHLGRTTTHEVGHYLNLRHIWGGFSLNCGDDDCVTDTPNQSTIYLDCPSHPQESCGSKDLFMNYMNYVPDECMYLFTHGQKWRMLATLHGPRSGLLNSNGCGNAPEMAIPSILNRPYVVYPNPASDILNVYTQSRTQLQSLNLLTIDGRSVLVPGCIFLSKGKLQSLDLTTVPAGIYILHIRLAKKDIYEKIIIQ